MKCTIIAREPNILREAKPGDMFLVHTIGLAECACIRTYGTNEVELQTIVIGCRVSEGSEGYFPPGALFRDLHPDTPITLLEQVEPFAFRERVPRDSIDVKLDALELGKVPTGRVVYRAGEQRYEHSGEQGHDHAEATFGTDPAEAAALDEVLAREAREERAAAVDQDQTIDKEFDELIKKAGALVERASENAQRILKDIEWNTRRVAHAHDTTCSRL